MNIVTFIRKKTNAIGGVLLIFVLLYLAPYVQTTSKLQEVRPTAGRIAGKTIPLSVYNTRLRETSALLQLLATGQSGIDGVTHAWAWESCQYDAIRKMTDAAGIVCTKEELITLFNKEELISPLIKPFFRDPFGHFSMSDFQRFYRRRELEPAIRALERRGENDAKGQKMSSLIAAGMQDNTAQLQQRKNLSAPIVIDALIVPASTVTDEPTPPAEEEIKKEIAHLASLPAEGYTRIFRVVHHATPSEHDRETATKKLEAAISLWKTDIKRNIAESGLPPFPAARKNKGQGEITTEKVTYPAHEAEKQPMLRKLLHASDVHARFSPIFEAEDNKKACFFYIGPAEAGSDPEEKQEFLKISMEVPIGEDTLLRYSREASELVNKKATTLEQFRAQAKTAPEEVKVWDKYKSRIGYLGDEQELYRWAWHTASRKSRLSPVCKLGRATFVVAFYEGRYDGKLSRSELRAKAIQKLLTRKKGEVLASQMQGKTMEELTKTFGPQAHKVRRVPIYFWPEKAKGKERSKLASQPAPLRDPALIGALYGLPDSVDRHVIVAGKHVVFFKRVRKKGVLQQTEEEREKAFRREQEALLRDYIEETIEDGRSRYY